MSKRKPKGEGSADSFVQVDAYGVKLKAPIGSGGKGGERPNGWKDVAKRVNGHLQRLATDCFGLVADVLDAARRLAQSIGKFASGTGKLPDAISKRIVESGHQKAEIREEKRQLTASESGARGKPLLPNDEASDRLQRALEHIREKGGCVAIVEVKNLVQAVVMVKEEQLAETIARLQESWGGDSRIRVYDRQGKLRTAFKVDTSKPFVLKEEGKFVVPPELSAQKESSQGKRSGSKKRKK